MSTDAFVAANRFGLGARPGDYDNLRRDPRGALLAQLSVPSPVDRLPDTASALAIAASRRPAMAPQGKGRDRADRPDNPVRALYMREVGARFHRCVTSAAPLRERLVQFWSNHFTVSIARSGVVPLAGVFEREAIAPFVTGRFADLLKAAVLHPAMLTYLDQARSVGPDSVVGQRRDIGLNENLGREILELHTLGVDGGYGQHDVIALAQILTGWSVVAGGGPDPKQFGFDDRRHQPGDKTLLGTTVREAGRGETDAALAMLAAHPATARHLATKLVRHFVADDPPAQLVARIAGVYRDSGGDLTQVTRALIAADAVWQTPLAKMKTPWDLAVSLGRALGDAAVIPGDAALFRTMRSLGQTPFSAPSPAGWPDRTVDWLGPDALMRRIDLVSDVAARSGGSIDLEALLATTIAPVTAADKLAAIRGAGDLVSAVTMLFASAEFQRR